MLKWIFERVDARAEARNTPIGYVPDALDIEGLALSSVEQLFAVDREKWLQETDALQGYFAQFGAKLPAAIREELGLLQERLAGSFF